MSHSDYSDPRSVAVITGACGGMGQACARLLGRRYRLLLSDTNIGRVETLAAQLTAEGHNIAGAMGVDVRDAAALQDMATATNAAGTLGALVHTAGLSPALADWRLILQVNLVGTALLLDAFQPLVTQGSVAVLIASVAGHQPQSDTVLRLIDQPLAPELIDRLEPLLRQNPAAEVPYGLQGLAYGVSKHAVIRLCEQRAAAWAARGGRIASVSPGMIATPMGQKELADNELAARMMDAVPHQRVGSPIDIANAVDFLCSDYAAYINGCDLRVDFGAVAGMRFPADR